MAVKVSGRHQALRRMNATDASSAQPMDIYARPQTMVRVNRRRRLNLQIMGDAGPTVVLAAGFPGVSLDWARVQPYAARFARTVSFDTAGLGFSDPGPMPRTADAIVDDLRAALKAARFTPPYVLVGHSAGGLRLRRYAERFPEEAAGLVLVDSVTDDWEHRLTGGPNPFMAEERRLFRRMLTLARAGALTPDTAEYRQRVGLPNPDLSPSVNAALHAMWTRPSYLRAAISESLHLGSQGRPAPASTPLGDLPLVVLSAARIAQSDFLNGDAQLARVWFAMHEELANLSTRGVRRTIDSGHNIPVEQPREVVKAIEDILAMM
jgi:pimeloyl-ACP methyl ester carboxylesterase